MQNKNLLKQKVNFALMAMERRWFCSFLYTSGSGSKWQCALQHWALKTCIFLLCVSPESETRHMRNKCPKYQYLSLPKVTMPMNIESFLVMVFYNYFSESFLVTVFYNYFSSVTLDALNFL